MICKSCENKFEGIYCNQCGQKVITERFTVKSFFATFIAIITNVESGFWRTVVDLFKQPAQVINDYINGKTKPYYHPLRYIIILTTLSALFNIYFGVFDATQTDMQHLFNPNATDEEIARQHKVNEYIKQYLNIIPILMIPFISIVSYRLFKKHQLNYAEHLVANTYMGAQLNFIGFPFLVLYAVFPEYTTFSIPLAALTSSLFYAYVYQGLFKVSYLKGWGFGLLAYTLGLLLMATLGIILAIAGVIVYVLLFK